MEMEEKDKEEVTRVEDGKHAGDYSLPSLDVVWFPLVHGRLKGGEAEAGAEEMREEEKVIGGRGTFDVREMEKELKAMGRDKLENELGEGGNLGIRCVPHFARTPKFLGSGISMHKVRDILKRSDIHGNGQIEYKVSLDFLLTLTSLKKIC